MTDPELAARTYVEPLEWRTLEAIIARERPDAVLPTLGGQTALNLALKLDKEGVFKKYGVELLGAKPASIEKAEDRSLFKAAMDKIGLTSARAGAAHTVEEAWEIVKTTGFPSILRPSFTLGGTGGGIAENESEFEAKVKWALSQSPTSEVLIEESLLGWKEYELEVMRDKNDNFLVVCSIENIDPMGVHTGDSITCAPAMTLTDKEYQRLRDAARLVMREIGVESGGSNVQFAVNPADGRVIVIEMNPRVSRSSALASKATGYPIAKIAAKLAVGYTLDELTNDITGTSAAFEPTLDYVVVKWPRFAFEKFPGAETTLGTQMKSVGEVMSIGRTFTEALNKAARSLETGRDGMVSLLDRVDYPALVRPKKPRDMGMDAPEYEAPPSVRHVADGVAARHDAAREALRTLVSDPDAGSPAARGRRHAPRHRRRGAVQADQDRPLVPRQHPHHRGDGVGAQARAVAARAPGRQAHRHRRPAHRPHPRAHRGRDPRAPARRRHPPGVRPGRHLRRRVRGEDAVPVQHVRIGERGRAAPPACPRSSSSAAVPTASGRGSSSTTAASTRCRRCASSGTRPSWSTATRRPSRPTTTPPTASTSSRSRSRTCSPSATRRSRTAWWCSSAGRRRSSSPSPSRRAG